MEKSNRWKCQWTDSTHTCPGAPLMWSLRPPRRPRRPSSIWTEVEQCSPRIVQRYTDAACTATVFYFLNNFLWWLFVGQIDGQEITASAVLTQRVRPPPRRLSPPRRMPPPPPMWRRSPPRMRRRCVEWFSVSNSVTGGLTVLGSNLSFCFAFSPPILVSS